MNERKWISDEILFRTSLMKECEEKHILLDRIGVLITSGGRTSLFSCAMGIGILPIFLPFPRLMIRLPLSVLLGMKWKEVYYWGSDFRINMNSYSLLKEMETYPKLANISQSIRKDLTNRK